jgi:lysophospholipase L1-like esterase
MSDRNVNRRLYYFDVVAVLAVAIIVLGHVWTRGGSTYTTALRDVAGVWMPLLAVTLLVANRRRAYTQATPWIAAAFACLVLPTIASIFWRANSAVFMGMVVAAALLLVTGLILRTSPVREPLRRTDVFALIVVTGGICIGVALTELFLRFGSGLLSEQLQVQLAGADPSNLGVPHPSVGYLHTPNHKVVMTGRDFSAVHTTDGLGFRNAWPWPKHAEIVAVGDSLTFGQCVQDDEAWPFRLGRDLSPLRVVNLGLIGAGPQQYQRLYEAFGVKLRPKLLIVAVFARNDFWDADTFDRWLQSGRGGNFMVWRAFGQPPALDLKLSEPRGSLERLFKSTVVPAVRRSYTFALVRALQGGVEGEGSASARVYTFPGGGRVELFESDFLNKTSSAKPGRRPFRIMLESLERIRALASEHGTQVLTVLLPGKEEVHLPLLDGSTLDPTSALRAAMDQRGLEYVDLAPIFLAHAKAGEQLFYEVDGHPNPAGQSLIARVIEAHVRANAGRYGLAD